MSRDAAELHGSAHAGETAAIASRGNSICVFMACLGALCHGFQGAGDSISQQGSTGICKNGVTALRTIHRLELHIAVIPATFGEPDDGIHGNPGTPLLLPLTIGSSGDDDD
jgi:hypothetical protein